MALPAGLPKYTLGWGVLDWGSTYLAHPDGDLAGRPWVFTAEQAKFVLWFYAVDEHGAWIYRRAVLERPKGWGKSPFAAALAACELLGPTKFAGFDAQGRAVGRPVPNSLVQIAAISEAQVENSYNPLMEMLSLGKADSAYDLDIGQTRIKTTHNRGIFKVTASPASREGAQSTFIIADETHLWTPAQHGHDLAAVCRRNLAKKGGRLLETTNAHVPGQQSVAEASHDYALLIENNKVEETGLLFDSRRTTCENIYDQKQFMEAVTYVYGDAVWIDKNRLWREVNDPANTESEIRRFYLNELHRGDTQWIRPSLWRAVGRDNLKLKKSDKFALGFTGQARNGAAALSAVRLTDMAVFHLKMWEKPADAPRDWEVNYREVDSVVRKWLARLGPSCFLLANPWNYQDIVGRWAVDFEGQVEAFWTNQKLNFTKAVEQFEEAVYTERLIHDNNPDLARHIDNCHVEDTTAGHTIRKEMDHSKNYISAAQAAVIAYEAAQLSIAEGALKEKDATLYTF